MFNLVLYSRDSSAAVQAAADAFRLVDSLNVIFSDYIPESELNRLCRASGNGEWVNVSEPLFTILQAAYQAGRLSGGRFDITVGPLSRLWRKARKDKILPTAGSIRHARKLTGYRFIEMDSAKQAVRLKTEGMQLDLGGIAKGETAQRVIRRLSQFGFPYALLDAGGDVVAGAVPPGITGWRVAINMPESETLMSRLLLLHDEAVTTSGDLYQYVYLNGKRYSHIINPLTGYALTNSRNVTVISKSGIAADWLTKACSIMPVEKAMRLIRRFPSTEVQIAFLKKDKPVFYRSPGFDRYFVKEEGVRSKE